MAGSKEAADKKNLPVRLPPELRAALRQEAYRRGQATGRPEPSFGSLLMELWESRHHAPDPPAPQKVVEEMPSPFAGLSPDDLWLVQNFIQLIRQKPQGAIFQALENVLRGAIREFTRSEGQAPALKPALKKTPTARLKVPPRNESWHDLLEYILQFGSETDVTGIKANLEWGASAVRTRKPTKQEHG